MKMIDTHTVMLSDETPTALCALLQDAASQHQSLLGSGREEMQSHGLLWMVMRQKLLLHRAPVSGETVTIRTWLSEARHGMYLRQYELTDAVGAALCQAAAVWALVDAESRTLAQLRLDVPLCQQECRLPRFPLLRPIETTQEYTFTVPTEYLDVGCTAELPGAMTAEEFLDVCRRALHSPDIRFHDGGKSVSRITICSGAGGDLVSEAGRNGSDTLLTGEIHHHQWIEGEELGLNLIEAGHFATENVVVPVLEGMISEEFPSLRVVCSESSHCVHKGYRF